MTTRQAGEPIADFTLDSTAGRPLSSATVRQDSLLLFVLYKKSCGTCQFTFPYLQRFHEYYAGPAFSIWGVAQDPLGEAFAFAQAYGATFPQLSDAALDVTEDYRPVSVPTWFLADRSDRILMSGTGFSTDGLNELSAVIARRTSQIYRPVVTPEDNAPAFKPG